MTEVATISKKRSLVTKFADRFGVEPEKMMSTLKATAFRVKDGEATNEQMMALLVVADQYGLNPWTKEIYAFPDKQNGIVPVVGVDGWARIINENDQFDGMEFAQSETMVKIDEHAKESPQWMECTIYRKDRARPITVREYLDEVYRAPFKGKYGPVIGPWQTHTKRFLRHKVMIQCARVAFGYVGIYDQDEAERIVERDMGAAERVPASTESAGRPALQQYPDERFAENLPRWREAIESGAKSAEDIITMVSTRWALSEDQKRIIREIEPAMKDSDPGEPAEAVDADWMDAYNEGETNNANA